MPPSWSRRLWRCVPLAFAASLLAAPAARALDVPTNAPPAIAGGVRGLWVWSSDPLLSSPSRQAELARVAGLIGVTDLYVFINPNWYASRPDDLTAFLTLMGKNHLKVWATDGCRCYLDDADGPANYFRGIDGLIAFNKRAAPWARFTGFQTDTEPQDIKSSKATFHNDIASSKLSPTSGGVWKASQAADRDALLLDWLTIQQKASEELHAQGLRFGAAMPWWTEDYNGEPLTVDIGGGERARFSQVTMGLVDDYVIMSYDTDPLAVAEHVATQAAFASAIAGASRPRVSAAMETNKDIGAKVSYGDTPGKQSKAMVLVDMNVIQQALARYPAFAGVSIEDWAGFRDLPR